MSSFPLILPEKYQTPMTDPVKADRKGQYAISINDQWRICFKFDKGDACDVEITDYH